MTRVASRRDPATVPWRSPLVQVVLASTLLAPLGVALISPVLPVVRETFALTDAQASLLISIYFLMGIVLSPFIGLVADRIGCRPILISSLGLFGLTGGAMAFTADYQTILLIRLVQGAAAAGIFITTVTLIGDAFEGAQRHAVLGVNVAALSTGAAIYPIVGGALVAIAWNVPFLVYLISLPVGLVAVFALEEPTIDREPRSPTYLHGAFQSIANREAVAMYGTAFLTEVVVLGVILTMLPLMLTATYGLSPLFIGLILMVTEVSSIIVASQDGRLAKYASDNQLIALAFVCFGLGLLGLWLAPTPVFIALAVAIVGAGIGLSMPSVDAAIADLVPVQYRAEALSIRNSTTSLGRATGPVLFVWIAARIGYRPLLLAAGVIALAGGMLTMLTTSGKKGGDAELSAEGV